MRHFPSIKAWLVSLIVSSSAGTALANDVELATPKSTWSTSSHLGYAVADRSSMGFEQAGGTLVLLDIAHPISADFDLGMRSIAEGAQNPTQQFYRLGAGPLATYRINRDWVLQAAVAVFNESGYGPQRQKTYQSRGEEVQIGWERSHHFNRQVEVAAGAFAAYHRGGLAATAATLNSTKGLASTGENSGLSHGFEAALRLKL